MDAGYPQRTTTKEQVLATNLNLRFGQPVGARIPDGHQWAGVDSGPAPDDLGCVEPKMVIPANEGNGRCRPNVVSEHPDRERGCVREGEIVLYSNCMGNSINRR